MEIGEKDVPFPCCVERKEERMRKCLVAFALVVAMGTAMAGDCFVPCEVTPVCPPPAPVCLPFTKKVASCNPCDPCATDRVAVACPNIWGKLFGARHAPTK